MSGVTEGTAAGAARRERAQGRRAEALQDSLRSLDPGVAGWADSFVFGEVWGRPGLAFDDRMLVAITALATGGHHGQLRNYLFGAVQDGMSARRIQEALTMLVVYAGFPVALQALDVWAGVRDSCVRSGIELDLADAEGDA